MMTAKDALAISLEAMVANSYNIQQANIRISKAAQAGDRDCFISSLTNEEGKYLREKGFEVSFLNSIHVRW